MRDSVVKCKAYRNWGLRQINTRTIRRSKENNDLDAVVEYAMRHCKDYYEHFYTITFLRSRADEAVVKSKMERHAKELGQQLFKLHSIGQKLKKYILSPSMQ